MSKRLEINDGVERGNKSSIGICGQDEMLFEFSFGGWVGLEEGEVEVVQVFLRGLVRWEFEKGVQICRVYSIV